MLDLIFLVLMIIVLVKAINGDYNETLCNVAIVVGIIAAILGIISALFGNSIDAFSGGMLNILVIIIAAALRPVAKHFAKLHQDKLDEQIRIIEEETKRITENTERPVTRDSSYIIENGEPPAEMPEVVLGNRTNANPQQTENTISLSKK